MTTTSKFKTIRVDIEVANKIAASGSFGESVNDVLRRILKMPERKDSRGKK
jgi:negative regulator of replication initiation